MPSSSAQPAPVVDAAQQQSVASPLVPLSTNALSEKMRKLEEVRMRKKLLERQLSAGASTVSALPVTSAALPVPARLAAPLAAPDPPPAICNAHDTPSPAVDPPSMTHIQQMRSQRIASLAAMRSALAAQPPAAASRQPLQTPNPSRLPSLWSASADIQSKKDAVRNQKELQRITDLNTRRNAVRFVRFVYNVVRRPGAPPPSPTSVMMERMSERQKAGAERTFLPDEADPHAEPAQPAQGDAPRIRWAPELVHVSHSPERSFADHAAAGAAAGMSAAAGSKRKRVDAEHASMPATPSAHARQAKPPVTPSKSCIKARPGVNASETGLGAATTTAAASPFAFSASMNTSPVVIQLIQYSNTDEPAPPPQPPPPVAPPVSPVAKMLPLAATALAQTRTAGSLGPPLRKPKPKAAKSPDPSIATGASRIARPASSGPAATSAQSASAAPQHGAKRSRLK
ncbi:hypothetical protein HK105_206890 [Polyrhizophydium stewartii]|uniref:Uncharacterized protein n=1 Tax=Polyrhizophydium stewartii TaxID=2732419 RepID=A0ABR4N240_9FUNG